MTLLKVQAISFTIAALLLARSANAQQAAPVDNPPAGAATCPADTDISGLLDGLDREVLKDVVAVLMTYRAERVHLCEALRQAGIKESIAQQSRRMAETLAEIWQRDADTCHEAMRELPVRRALPFGWSIGVGGCVDGDGELSVCGAGVFGWRF